MKVKKLIKILKRKNPDSQIMVYQGIERNVIKCDSINGIDEVYAINDKTGELETEKPVLMIIPKKKVN